MKLKHYSLFKTPIKSLTTAEDWDSLRNDQSDDYFLPYSLTEYLKKVDVPYPSKTTEIIIDKTNSKKLSKVFSIGSGVAQLEYQLKKFSTLYITVSDYNKSILRLKEFNIFDECLLVDILNDPFPADSTFLLLFPRIDTEFEDQQLKDLFRKCYQAGVSEICFIPAQLLSIRIVLAEIKFYLISLLTSKKRVFCGYSRSKGEFLNLFKDHYRLDEEFKAEKYFMFLKRLD